MIQNSVNVERPKTSQRCKRKDTKNKQIADDNNDNYFSHIPYDTCVINTIITRPLTQQNTTKYIDDKGQRVYDKASWDDLFAKPNQKEDFDLQQNEILIQNNKDKLKDSQILRNYKKDSKQQNQEIQNKYRNYDKISKTFYNASSSQTKNLEFQSQYPQQNGKSPLIKNKNYQEKNNNQNYDNNNNIMDHYNNISQQQLQHQQQILQPIQEQKNKDIFKNTNNNHNNNKYNYNYQTYYKNQNNKQQIYFRNQSPQLLNYNNHNIPLNSSIVNQKSKNSKNSKIPSHSPQINTNNSKNAKSNRYSVNNGNNKQGKLSMSVTYYKQGFGSTHNGFQEEINEIDKSDKYLRKNIFNKQKTQRDSQISEIIAQQKQELLKKDLQECNKYRYKIKDKIQSVHINKGNQSTIVGQDWLKQNLINNNQVQLQQQNINSKINNPKSSQNQRSNSYKMPSYH